MMTNAFISDILKIQSENVRQNVPMKDYTTFKIGGPADLFIEPENRDKLSLLIRLCVKFNIPFMFIGAGSNILISDKGIDGVVFKLSDSFDYVDISGTDITAGAATSLAKLAKCAQRQSLSGLEFASGIPGSLGGAVLMNAGAYGGEMKDVITETEYIDKCGDIRIVKKENHDFSHRHSFFSDGGKYILSSKMSLIPKDKNEISATMKDLNNRRKEKQPLEKPSAGSTFKRPEGFFAAKLIEDAGLKGISVGDACVSEKHAGFIVNNGNASCDDVMHLIEKVQNSVFEKFGIKLEPEVRIIGR